MPYFFSSEAALPHLCECLVCFDLLNLYGRARRLMISLRLFALSTHTQITLLKQAREYSKLFCCELEQLLECIPSFSRSIQAKSIYLQCQLCPIVGKVLGVGKVLDEGFEVLRW
jgi:hypothetical protein